MTSALCDSNAYAQLPLIPPDGRQAEPEHVQGQEGHIGSEEQLEEVHDAQEADGKQGGLADDKAVRNRGRCRGSGPEHPPQEGWVGKSRLLGRLEGREAAKNYNGTMGDLVYRNRKGGSAKARKGLAFT